jgi:hypothetical protein
MRFKSRNYFLLEQDDAGTEPSAGEGTPFVAPKDRLITTPDARDSFIETDASVDEKIDKYLMQYEKDAVPLPGPDTEKEPGSAKPIGEGKFTKLSYILFEQDAPPADAPPADAPPPDAPAETPPSDAAAPSGSAEVAPVPKINIRKFAEGIARLVNNYQSLIDPKRIILNRAQAYITKNYSTRLAKELMSILERDFDLTSKTNNQRQEEYPPAPRAGAAGPAGGGGGAA